MKHLEDIGEADNTIVIFSTDNGAEVFTWPDGGMTPFKGTKGTAYEGGFRAPCIVRWPGRIKPGTVQNGLFSSLDWFPTFLAAAGNPNITEQLLKGVRLGDRTYKNHLDGYDQIDLLLDKGPSTRHEYFYFAGPHLGALRLDDFKFQFFRQPEGWPGGKITTDMPGMVNIRQDPFERTPSINSESSEQSRRRLHERLLCPGVLAVRPRPGEGRGAGQDGDRIPADAGPGVLQPGGGEAADRRDDQEQARTVIGLCRAGACWEAPALVARLHAKPRGPNGRGSPPEGDSDLHSPGLFPSRAESGFSPVHSGMISGDHLSIGTSEHAGGRISGRAPSD